MVKISTKFATSDENGGPVRQYFQGFGCIIVVFAVVAAVAFLIYSLPRIEALDAVIPLSFGVGLAALGYVYKRWNGPLIFSDDGKAVARLLPFLLGVGTLVGPATIYFGNYPLENLGSIEALFWLLISVPLTGIPVFASMLIGSAFCTREVK